VLQQTLERVHERALQNGIDHVKVDLRGVCLLNSASLEAFARAIGVGPILGQHVVAVVGIRTAVALHEFWLPCLRNLVSLASTTDWGHGEYHEVRVRYTMTPWSRANGCS
jgi:hypothetical protein